MHLLISLGPVCTVVVATKDAGCSLFFLRFSKYGKICSISIPHRFDIQVDLGPDNIKHVNLKGRLIFLCSNASQQAITCLSSIHFAVFSINNSLWVASTPGTRSPVLKVRLGGWPPWRLTCGFCRPSSNSTMFLIWSQRIGFNLKIEFKQTNLTSAWDCSLLSSPSWSCPTSLHEKWVFPRHQFA